MNFFFLLRAIIITFPAQEGLSKGFHREVSNVCSTEKSHSKLMSKKGVARLGLTPFGVALLGVGGFPLGGCSFGGYLFGLYLLARHRGTEWVFSLVTQRSSLFWMPE